MTVTVRDSDSDSGLVTELGSPLYWGDLLGVFCQSVTGQHTPFFLHPSPSNVLERLYTVGGAPPPPRPPSPNPPPLPMFEANSQNFALAPRVGRLQQGPQGDPRRRGVPAKPSCPPPSDPSSPSNTSLPSPLLSTPSPNFHETTSPSQRNKQKPVKSGGH